LIHQFAAQPIGQL